MKRFCATLIVVAATIAMVFTVAPARAATPPQGNPTLVVRLDADGSLTLSQSDSHAGAAVTLPSIQALPAQIDAFAPHTAERKKLDLSADSKGPYRNFLNVMNVAQKAGFSEIGILGPETGTQAGAAELVVDLLQARKWPPNDKALFVSLGEDGDVVLSLGIAGVAKGAQGKVVDPASAPDTIIGLVPKGRAQKEVYFRADFEVSVGKAVDLLRNLREMGFKNITIIGEETE